MSKERYRWSDSDDLAALYLYKFRDDHLPYKRKGIAGSRNLPIGSLNIRIENFRFLGGQGGLAHFSSQSKKIFDQYHNLTEPELRRLAFPEQ